MPQIDAHELSVFIAHRLDEQTPQTVPSLTAGFIEEMAPNVKNDKNAKQLVYRQLRRLVRNAEARMERQHGRQPYLFYKALLSTPQPAVTTSGETASVLSANIESYLAELEETLAGLEGQAHAYTFLVTKGAEVEREQRGVHLTRISLQAEIEVLKRYLNGGNVT
ncbi:hypothetical protein FJ444_14350 [Aestuariibacter sp. GS-14]|uniref:hypothetical protein n=1 Tax=Alteromonadaceae TaxID=72275 RepID=UPI001127F937|nr:hypothetical protein [Aestuariibacter sp. GS-14]TPV56929.1 hypothetical protein FJ444_14350 [Aestuariibacter sp. GS-14]